jgi:hypothetical protein
MSENHDKKCCCPGQMGPAGPAGNAGLQGIPGEQGQPGQTGLQGVPGVPGEPGPAGNDGLQGIAGPAGPRGLTGAAGQQGLQGQPGQNGKTGPAGPQGNPGEQGIQGVPGDCVECPCDCKVEYAFLYSLLSQTLALSPALNTAGGVVLYENAPWVSSGIDVSNAAITGEIVINTAGLYRIQKEICGALNPVSFPLTAWGLSVFVNGVLVAGSTFVDMTLSPDQQANETSSVELVYFNVGDKLTICNMSTKTLNLNGGVVGVNCATNSASLNIALVKAA